MFSASELWVGVIGTDNAISKIGASTGAPAVARRCAEA